MMQPDQEQFNRAMDDVLGETTPREKAAIGVINTCAMLVANDDADSAKALLEYLETLIGEAGVGHAMELFEKSVATAVKIRMKGDNDG